MSSPMSLAYKTCPECGYPAPLHGVKCYRCKRKFQHPIIRRRRRLSSDWGWVFLECTVLVFTIVGMVAFERWLR